MVDWAGVFLIGVLIFVWDLIGSNFEPGLVACNCIRYEDLLRDRFKCNSSANLGVEAHLNVSYI